MAFTLRAALACVAKQKNRHEGGFLVFGGERGIRTLDTGLPYTHFPGVLLQPLGHLSKSGGNDRPSKAQKQERCSRFAVRTLTA